MLHIHRAERADVLADAVAALLAHPLDDPFAAEIVSVPTRGMERWLSQRLSARLGASAGRSDGVCANVLFPPPRRLTGDVIAAASGVDPDTDPWLPERAVWPLLAVVDAHLHEPWLETLAAYLGHGTDAVRRARRLSVARHLADLFDRYALHRPEMVRAWAGHRSLAGADAEWQAELWRALRARIGSPGPAERLEHACVRLRADASILDLPARVSLFGLTRLPAGDLNVLRALAAHRDVHLFLLHPSPALWNAVARMGPAVISRTADPTAELPSNDLLRSWGRDAREVQLVLGSAEEHVGHHHRLDHEASTLLQRIQADVRADRRPPGAPLGGEPDRRPRLKRQDRSIQVHACHGRARQVEVLRDAVLHQLADDHTLEPRDVIVMCPDVEAFAPLIQATFGAGSVDADGEPGPGDLRVRLADRSLRQTNAVLAVVAELLDLVDQRLTASQVLDFADRDAVRRRFGFSDDDLTRVQSWIRDAGIRWGLDAGHRAPFNLESLPSGTWRAGLDRVLLGVAMTEDGDRLWRGVLPVDDVDSGVIDLAGRFAELVARLADALDMLSADKPLAGWASAIADATDAVTATAERDAWQRLELQRVLDELVQDAGVDSTSLALAEVRALLADKLAGRPTRANFRTGHLTVCTLYPMRSVPHRVVCLLGLDDGAFPRKAPRDGDDLMLEDPHVGERDSRSEDRQLLLDALLAATERLVITYTGNDERTNIPRPPAVPVGELLDVVDATVRADAGPARAQVVVRHPLQPFDPRNFARNTLVPEVAWSFDGVTLHGARAIAAPRARRGPFLSEPLPALHADVVELDDLVRFVQHPVRAFLRQRLRITLTEIADDIDDALPIELDGLERWGVGQRLLNARLAGVDGRSAALAEIARGTLPPGVLGEPVVRDLWPTVEAIVSEARALLAEAAEPNPVDVRAALPDGRLLSGTVTAAAGDVLLQSTYSRVSARHRLASWVRLLAATASHPERAFSAATVGRASGNGRVTLVLIKPPGSDATARRQCATMHLASLVELYDRGMREPLPLYCLSSHAYAEAVLRGDDGVEAARHAWTSKWNFDKEDVELEHQLVLDGVRRFEDLLAPPLSDEQGPGWDSSEATRFGRYARRLWDALLRYEELTTR